jgi:perosamine synthetase
MFVPVSQPLLGDIETKYVTDAIKKGDISGLSGTYIKQFEDSFAKYCGVKHMITVNSGTTALHLAIAVLGIGKGDEVLVATFTNMATFFAVLYEGAKPIPIDVDPRTLNIDPTKLEKKITKKTKAIIVVHLYGHPADMDPIMKIAKKHKLYVIEDAAEAHGALYKGKKVGSIGHINCFSFYSNKIVTTGEGGGITTNNDEWNAKARLLKNLAFGEKDKFMHQALGFKFQMTNLQAAVGAAQMTKIDTIIKIKRDMAKAYLKGLAGIPEIQLPVEERYAFNVYWMFNIVLRGKLSGRRREFMTELKKRGVDTREDFVPYNQQKVFIKQGLTKPSDCPVVNTLYDDGLYLPSGTKISKKEIEYVINNVREVVRELTK